MKSWRTYQNDFSSNSQLAKKPLFWGNVHVVVTDRKHSTILAGPTIGEFNADVVVMRDYYPFGMEMEGQRYAAGEYRYGFNGMERDDELKGSGDSYDFGARMYDPRVGRWMIRDPLAGKYPGNSSYKAFLLNPIFYIDPSGMSETGYYDEDGNLIEHVDDGFDQSVKVNESQFQKFKSLAQTGGLDLCNEMEAKEFTLQYESESCESESVKFTRVGWWSTKSNVLRGKQFINYGYGGECFDWAKDQNELAGVSPGGSNLAIQVKVANSSRLKAEPEKAIAYIHSQLDKGLPIVVGVNHPGPDVGNKNSFTNHFINISGRGNDGNGNYFEFWDNAHFHSKNDPSINKLYLQNDRELVIPEKSGLEGGNGERMEVTEVRPNIKTR